MIELAKKRSDDGDLLVFIPQKWSKKNMDDSENQSTLEYKDDFWI